MTNRVVLYARVSSDDRHREDRNLLGQLDMCREHAQQRGLQIIDELAEDDRGASGAAFELPQLNRVRELARTHQFDVLIVRELDRLSRSLAKQLIVEEELKHCGVRIEYVLGEYPDTPEGNLMKNVKASIAEYERLKITERMERGKQLKIKAGSVMVGKRPPFGYRAVEQDRKQVLEISESEAQTVRLIFSWYTEGDGTQAPMSQRGIQKRLNELGIPTPGDLSHQWARKKRGWAQWNQSSIGSILGNATYAGKWYYGKHSKENRSRRFSPNAESLAVDVPPIIGPETWAVAQQKLVENQEKSPRNQKYEYLLNQRLHCGKCGVAVGCDPAHGSRLYQYYRCRAHGRTSLLDYAHDCDMPSFRADHVDPKVWEWVRSLLVDDMVLVQGLTAIQSEREQEIGPIRERLRTINALLADNQSQLQRLIDLYLTGAFSKELLLERKLRMETTIGELTHEREGLALRLEAQTLTPERIQGLQSFAAKVGEKLVLADSSLQARKQIIEMLDVRGTLSIEEDQKVVYARCILGARDLPITNTTSPARAGRTPAARPGRAPRGGPG
ncbi:MAG: recombinase family protein [Chloroflexi bacterium]|nr:recombinase family protein [Chloroflexota bacterium]